MMNNEIISNISSYIDTVIKPALLTAQTRFSDRIYEAIKEDLWNDYSPSEFRKQLPHSVWLITKIGQSLDDTPKSKMERTALTDILLGKQEIDEVGEPTFYYDESSNQLTINQGYYYTIGLSKDFPKVVESFRRSKRNDSLPAAMGLALEEMVQRNIQFTDAIAEQFTNSDYITKALAKSFSNNNFKLKQEGIEFAPGDFKMGIGDKLLGHIDIKYTTKGPSNPNRYLNMIHINNDNSAKPLNEIAKIIEGYTFHGDKKHIDNMVLLYMYPDDGYWATKVLNEVKKILLTDLKEQDKEGVDLSKKNVSYLKELWYGK